MGGVPWGLPPWPAFRVEAELPSVARGHPPMSLKAPLDDTDERPIQRDELAELFRQAEKPLSEFKVGGEAEKFGVDRTTGEPVTYDGPRGVRRVFDALVAEHGWTPVGETPGGPTIALHRGRASITLEPAAQLELSGAPFDSVHDIYAEMKGHLEEIEVVSREMNVVWLGVGFHPLATLAELPWVPKQRYRVMKGYLPARGAGGLDMMKRTATVQANFDYSSEADAMAKLVVMLKLSPLLNAMTANSPFSEGRVCGRKSQRGHVWLRMDPARSGLIPSLWAEKNPTYEHYVEWALDAGMFLFRRGDDFIANTGQTFRSFLQDGFEGHRPTRADWTSHVNSLFPEGRLKRTLEARAADSLPLALACSVPALLIGVLYDSRAFDEMRALVEPLTHDATEGARPDLVTRGLEAKIGGISARDLALRFVEIASGGLQRRARSSAEGHDERIFLRPLADLIAHGRSPADLLLAGISRTTDARVAIADLIGRTRL
jgi:glutamate--cysteine ligase